MKKFGASLSDSQIRLARLFQNNGLTSFSQAVKAFERGDDERIEAWKTELETLKTEGKFVANFK